MPERTLVVEQPVQPPDGGWGWVVVFAGFVCHIVVDGIVYSSGVFFDEFVTYFKEGHAATSWIGSILMASYLMSSKTNCGSVVLIFHRLICVIQKYAASSKPLISVIFF